MLQPRLELRIALFLPVRHAVYDELFYALEVGRRHLQGDGATGVPPEDRSPLDVKGVEEGDDAAGVVGDGVLMQRRARHPAAWGIKGQSKVIRDRIGYQAIELLRGAGGLVEEKKWRALTPYRC